MTRKPAPASTSRRIRRATAAVLVDIDPAISGGFILGRFDIMIRGRALSPEPIEEIALFADGGAAARLQYGPQHGRYDEAGIVRLPDGTETHQHSFQLTLQRPERRAAEPCPFRITVRTASGREHEEPFELVIEPGAAVPVRLRSIPPHPVAGNIWPIPPTVLYVERALLDGGGNLQVYGWAVSQLPLVAVRAFVGDLHVASAGVTGERADVAEVYPAYPNARISGFSINARLEKANRSASVIRAQAVSQRGYVHEVSVPLERVHQRRLRPATPRLPDTEAEPEPVPPAAEPDALPIVATNDPRRAIDMFCDKASLSTDGEVFVTGWAVCPLGISRIAVFVDDRPVGEAKHGFERLDVGAKFPSVLAAARSGFRLDAGIGKVAEGEHRLHVIATNGLGDEATVAASVLAAPPLPEAEVPASPDRPEFRFELDSPPLADGAAIEPITGRLTIDGWVLARSGVTGVKVFLDERLLGDAHYGLARQDVGVAFSEWPNALRSGYAFHCPPRSLRDGEHTVRIAVSARNGGEHSHSFRISVKRADDNDDVANIRRRMSRAEFRALAGLLDGLDCHPRFGLWLRHSGAVDPTKLQATLTSLREQVYPRWNLRILADEPAAVGALHEIIAGDAAVADRVEVIGPNDAEAWHAQLVAPDTAGPVFHGLLCPGDELGIDALSEFSLAAGLHPHANLLYADEARISPASQEHEAFFKPGFSPDLLLSTNYIGRPWVAAASVIAATGATPASLMRDGEYDLLLRCVEHVGSVRHLPKLLCLRGPVGLDDPAAEQAALARAAARRGFEATVLPAAVDGTWRLRRSIQRPGKVSIIIPTCAAHGHIKTCIASLRATTAYRNFEVVVIDNIPQHQAAWKQWVAQNADKVLDLPHAFNWSRFNNQAARIADGEYLLFLNDDIEVIQPEWLDAMLEHAQRPEVGVVGPQLLYPDRKVQHAGMFLGTNGLGRHAFRFNAEDEPGYFGLALTQRNVIAVTGACMLVRREVFDLLGGLDEAHEIINNDLDFCLRAGRAGLVAVFTPYAKLIHYELASRARLEDTYDLSHFNAAWKTLYAEGDPCFSPRLSRHADDYRPDDEAVQTIFPGHPLFEPAEITRILVVKLDHLGDFVTALPAMRRLKQMFPQASLTVLAGRASQAFVALEPCIDAFIPFDFFHTRSQLGERELSQQDYQVLRDQLAPYRFDLAVDLRKHLSTRDVLRHTGARFLAGFDYQGQFPFLDIALEWDGDKALQRKRGHIVDDLRALVGAIGSACEADRQLIQPIPPPASVDTLPDAVRPLFDRPVVAVHPGAGNVTKQWPVEHFSALIDLMVERDGVNVILIGGPDEVELADSLLRTLQNRARVVSLAGQTSLSELGALLTACALYVGNDSGPKHIAAALGVPTLGIHSGVVDATEWAPLGRRSVALRRNMSCSPCYLANAEDCPRNLACLRFLEPALVHQTAQMLLARPVAAASPGAVPAPTTMPEDPLSRGSSVPSSPPRRRERPRRRIAVRVSA